MQREPVFIDDKFAELDPGELKDVFYQTYEEHNATLLCEKDPLMLGKCL